MTRPKIYADFHNADTRGRLRLNCVGTIRDLERIGLTLRDGLEIVVSDDELEAEGRVEYSGEEQVWVATIDWCAVHQAPA